MKRYIRSARYEASKKDSMIFPKAYYLPFTDAVKKHNDYDRLGAKTPKSDPSRAWDYDYDAADSLNNAWKNLSVDETEAILEEYGIINYNTLSILRKYANKDIWIRVKGHKEDDYYRIKEVRLDKFSGIVETVFNRIPESYLNNPNAVDVEELKSCFTQEYSQYCYHITLVEPLETLTTPEIKEMMNYDQIIKNYVPTPAKEEVVDPDEEVFEKAWDYAMSPMVSKKDIVNFIKKFGYSDLDAYRMMEDIIMELDEDDDLRDDY